MLTTTIGAYPKPETVAGETWFGDRARRPGDGYEAAPSRMGAEAVSIEDVHRPNDLVPLERFAKTTVILALLPRDLARQKLTNLCAAAEAVG